MIPAHHRHRVQLEYGREDGSKYFGNTAVVAFNDNGVPLVADPQGPYGVGLVTPDRVEGVSRWSLYAYDGEAWIPAAPGWYAVFETKDDGICERQRYPVLAWRATSTTYDGSALVLPWNDEDGLPVEVRAYERSADNWRLVGIFHHGLCPEPVPETVR